MHATKSPTPELDALVRQEPDLVDRIFDYILSELPELDCGKAQVIAHKVRQVHGGDLAYVRKRTENVPHEVLRLFNGRNASEVARRLQISRATVYRVIKQAGRRW